MKPLEGITVLDCSQFLSAPSCGLRLADLGAKVIKIEKPDEGDICRKLYISNLEIEGESSLFHAINRNKEGITLDFKKDKDKEIFYKMLKKADIVLTNFRPGVTEKLGIAYNKLKEINPKIVYGEITGYGYVGPWRDKIGQDLLVQGMSGICYLNGNKDQNPLAMGLSIADLLSGEYLVQGILAALISREKEGRGSLIEVDLMSSILDVQFESFTTFLNDGHEKPERSRVNNANAYIDAPYGIYKTKNGYLAIAMCPLDVLANLIKCDELLKKYEENAKRDEIKEIIKNHLINKNTEYYLEILEEADIWCAKVMEWEELIETEGFKEIDMLQEIVTKKGTRIKTTRLPIKIDGEIYKSKKSSPLLGEDNDKYKIKS